MIELSRLGRSTGEAITLIDEPMQANIDLVILKEQHDMQSLAMVMLLFSTDFSMQCGVSTVLLYYGHGEHRSSVCAV